MLNNARIKFDLLDKESRLFNIKLLFVARETVNKILRKIKPKIAEKIKRVIVGHISLSPEVLSLRGGGTYIPSLKVQFGITDSEFESKYQRLITKIYDNIVITPVFSPKGNKLFSSLIIDLLPMNLYKSGILEYGYTSKPSNEKIKWLDWLLSKGGRVIVKNYDMIQANSKVSRTDGTIMVPSQKKHKKKLKNRKKLKNKKKLKKIIRIRPKIKRIVFYRRIYRVQPLSFQGTLKDNFITRAIKKAIPAIFEILESEIKKEFRKF